MKGFILKHINDIEGFKTAIKQLHWAADSLSQHKLCDEIADGIADYQDKVSEVEQSISGKFSIGSLKGTPYKVTTLKNFVNDVKANVNSFYSKLKKEGDKYIGMRSDVEAFLSDIERFSYLVDFTIKEGMRKRLRNHLNESKATLSDGKHSYAITENELRSSIRKAINSLKESISREEFAKMESKHYLERLKEFRKITAKLCELASGANQPMLANNLENLIDKMDETSSFIEEIS